MLTPMEFLSLKQRFSEDLFNFIKQLEEIVAKGPPEVGPESKRIALVNINSVENELVSRGFVIS